MDWKPKSRMHNTRELLQVMLAVAASEPGSAAHAKDVYDHINAYHAALITDDEDENRVRTLRASAGKVSPEELARLPKPKGIVEKTPLPKFSRDQEQQYSYRVRKEQMADFLYVLATLVQEPIRAMEEKGATITPEQKHAWYTLMIQYAGKPLGMREDWHPEFWDSYESICAFADKFRADHPNTTPTSRKVAAGVIAKIPAMMPPLARPFLGELGQSVIRASLAETDLPKQLNIPKSSGAAKALTMMEHVIRSVKKLIGGGKV